MLLHSVTSWPYPPAEWMSRVGLIKAFGEGEKPYFLAFFSRPTPRHPRPGMKSKLLSCLLISMNSVIDSNTTGGTILLGSHVAIVSPRSGSWKAINYFLLRSRLNYCRNGFYALFPMLGSRSRKTNIFTFFKPFLPPARSSPSPHALGKWKRRAWRAAANGKLIIESAGFEIRLRVINLLIMMLNTDSCSPIEAGAAGCCHRIICHILRSANQKNLAWFSLGFQFQL